MSKNYVIKINCSYSSTTIVQKNFNDGRNFRNISDNTLSEQKILTTGRDLVKAQLCCLISLPITVAVQKDLYTRIQPPNLKSGIPNITQ